jgi:hypothetical protein
MNTRTELLKDRFLRRVFTTTTIELTKDDLELLELEYPNNSKIIVFNYYLEKTMLLKHCVKNLNEPVAIQFKFPSLPRDCYKVDFPAYKEKFVECLKTLILS